MPISQSFAAPNPSKRVSSDSSGFYGIRFATLADQFFFTFPFSCFVVHFQLFPVPDTILPSMTHQQKQNLGLFLGAIVVIGGLYWAYGAYQNKQIADSSWPALDGGVYTSAVTRNDVTSLIPGDQLYDSGVVEGGIPALTNPKYASVLASDAVISDDLMGIDLAIGGERRFYPVQIMNWHMVVNDVIDSQHVSVTYCPLCGTGIVYDQTVGMTAVTLSATGKVYNNNTVLKDAETGSLWLQATGQAVQGSWIGESLSVIPSQMMAWKDWKDAYPSGLVLSTDTGIARDYTRHPYGNYDTSKGLYFPINHTSADFTSKWVTYGVTDGTNGVAFSSLALSGTGMMTAKLGEVPVMAVYNFETDTVRVFEMKSKNGAAHTFSYDFARKRLTDNENGNIWDADGWIARSNDAETALIEVPAVRGYWFCLAAMHPTWKAVTGSLPITDAAPTGTETKQ